MFRTSMAVHRAAEKIVGAQGMQIQKWDQYKRLWKGGWGHASREF